MNFSKVPAAPLDVERLKEQLASLCEQFHIDRFEPDELVELIEDGESVDWIVSQLKLDNAELDAAQFRSVLGALASVLAPAEEPEPLAEAEVELEEAAPATELAPETLPSVDLSQLDLTQIAPELEALTGMKLPPGINLKQIQKMMASPQGAFLADFGLFCQEQGIDLNSVSDPKQLEALNEQWMSTPRAAFQGKTPAELREENPSLYSFKKVETYRRPEPRIGRNDPCPCGSGKKYKKCCGKGK